MPSESLKLFRLLSFRYQADAVATVELWTDEPGGVYALRESWTLPATSGKQTETLICHGTTKGAQAKIVFRPSGKLYVYSGATYARRLGRTASDWGWHAIDVGASEQLVPIQIPIPPTSESYAEIQIPIPPTSEGYAEIQIPIPPTSEEYSRIDIPIPPTSEQLMKIQIPLPAAPNGPVWVELPMDE